MRKLILFLCLLFSCEIYAQHKKFDHNSNDLTINDTSLRIKLTVTDVDGNIYHTQKVGNQIWFIENLKTTKFNDGTPISKVNDSILWINTTNSSFCDAIGIITYSIEEESEIFEKRYKLPEYFYNQFTVINEKNACPVGWRVPDSSDFKELTKTILPKDSIVHVNKLGTIRTPNDLGFSDKPFGYRSGSNGSFNNYYDFGYWWTINKGIAADAWARCILYDCIFVDVENNYSQTMGMSIKCIKN